MSVNLGYIISLVGLVGFLAVIWGVCAVSARASREEERRKGGRL